MPTLTINLLKGFICRWSNSRGYKLISFDKDVMLERDLG